MHGHRFIDETNNKYGRLTVLRYHNKSKRGQSYWECQCECGNVVVVMSASLRNGKTVSCGCYNIERTREAKTTHGMFKNYKAAPIYAKWASMKSRCLNPNSTMYSEYGGRGITVCEEWMEFEPYRDWALTHNYSDNLQIDRTDNNKGYSPDNCRFVTRKENGRNKRNNVNLLINGETKTASEWAELVGINLNTLYWRIGRGWHTDDLLKPTRVCKTH